MGQPILSGKRILAVDDEPDVLTLLDEEIQSACSDCQFDKARTYEDAVARMISLTYDVVILDIMGVRGFDLLELAVSRKFPVAMLTGHAVTPEALKRSFEMGPALTSPRKNWERLFRFCYGAPRAKPVVPCLTPV